MSKIITVLKICFGQKWDYCPQWHFFPFLGDVQLYAQNFPGFYVYFYIMCFFHCLSRLFQLIVEPVLRVDIFLGATHKPMCPDWPTGQVLTNHTAGKCGFPRNPFTSLAFFQALSHSQRVSPPRLGTLQQDVLLVRRNTPQFSSLPLPF